MGGDVGCCCGFLTAKLFDYPAAYYGYALLDTRLVLLFWSWRIDIYKIPTALADVVYLHVCIHVCIYLLSIGIGA